jgi:hypothetical protein
MGKVTPPPLYGNSPMAEHYTSRVQRYTPVQESPYSQNMLAIIDVDLSSL